MSSMDHQSARMFPKPNYHHHQHHTMSACPVPPYSMPREDSITQGNWHASDCLPGANPRRRQRVTDSLSFTPPTPPRPELQPEHTACQVKRPAERGPGCVSPFRSVRKMKEPFQLRLPSSPSLESIAASAREVKASRPLSGRQTLRAWHSDQNLMATCLETFGLLPSPPLSDSRGSRPSTSSAYFSSRPDSEMEAGSERTKWCRSIQDISSCGACGSGQVRTITLERNTAEEPTNVHAAYSNLVKRCESYGGRFTPASTDLERTSSPSEYSDIDLPDKAEVCGSANETQRSRAGTVSSEGSSWLPSNLYYCERWLQGVPETADVKDGKSKEANRRKFQIVQSSPLLPERKCEVKTADEAVILDLTKTKPKLVDISRQSSPAMSHTMSTPQHPIPSTPDMHQHEISAFSPDTPFEMSDSGYASHNSRCSPDDFQDDKESVHSETASETAVCNKPALKEGPSLSSHKPKPTPEVNSSPKNQAFTAQSSNMSEKEERWWWDLEWTIEQLEQSVKDFPRSMLKLTSPVIMFLRQNNEKALIRPFRKIFPDAVENLLDCLCAALIARNHLASLPSTTRGTSSSSYRPTFSSLDAVSAKTYAKLAVQFTLTSLSHTRDYVLGPRSAELCTDLDRIVDNLLFAICGRSDETLKSAVLVLAQVLEAKV